MRFRWYEYAIYPFTFLGLGLALVVVGVGVTLATIVLAMIRPFRSFRNIIITVAIVALAGGYYFWNQYTAEHQLNAQSVSVTVTQNMSFAKLTDTLTALGVVDKPALFKLSARIRGIDRNLWTGRYDFSGAVSVRSVLDALGSGAVAMTSVTIPEGLRIEQTAGILAGALKFDSTELVRIAYDTTFCQKRYNLPNLEGYLLPETYRFPVGVSLTDVIDKLVTDTRDAVAEALDGENTDSLTEYEIVTLASIIEAEARRHDEQQLISAVYHNRLKKKMLLQADPAVRYGLRKYRRKLYFKDLDKDTPYNTYMHKGLPPGPINSPGKAAIYATTHPVESSFLYFVADGTGGHVFSETLREHNLAKQRIKSDRRKKKRG